jgi:hypothetical protein
MKTRALLGSSFIVVVIALVAVFAALLPTFAAGNTQASKITSKTVFNLEHQAGKATLVAHSVVPLTCGSSAVNGNLLVNVTEKVKNDADSGQAGNYWGFDTFTRTIKVWNLGSDTYCATVVYSGTFAALAGQKSPGSTSTTGGILTGDEVGTINGGYVAQITGPLDVTDPTNWPLTGKVNHGGVVDYQCIINPDGTLAVDPCPGAVDWTTKYFDTANSGFTFGENPWGWTYVGRDKQGSSDAGRADGVWVNASTGNSGDILDRD